MLVKAIDNYLTVRRAVGFKLITTERYLRYFVRFARARGDTFVRGTTVVDWAAQASTDAERKRRYQCVLRFARFIHAEEPRHEIPPTHVFYGRIHRPTPYLFTDNELHRLICAAGRLGPPGSLRPNTYKTLFTLLAVTGLRPTEACALRYDDISPDGLVIRETKFRKSRLVPIHDTTRTALANYREHRSGIAAQDDHLFVSLAQRPLSPCLVSRTFRQLLLAAKLPDHPGQPRVYDLRHRFATRTLETCSGNHDHVSRHMLALTTYLGHAHIESTYWYLESTPQLMTDIAIHCEDFVWGEPS